MRRPRCSSSSWTSTPPRRLHGGGACHTCQTPHPVRAQRRLRLTVRAASPHTPPRTVRLKMLYASSVEDIKRTLLADRTVAAYHCTTKDEFVYAGFRESSGPVATGSAFTEAERQVAKENAESQQERSEAAATHTLPFDLTDEARAALERFSGGDVNTVALVRTRGETRPAHGVRLTVLHAVDRR